MSPSQFIPARSSRHRVACIALYRALIREARAIPIPDELLRKGTQNPIPRLVRKAFVRNRTETSYRIVFSALGTGYNFLNLFKAAQNPDSTEHSQIIAHLREKRGRDVKAEAGKPLPREPRPEKPKWPPLLQKVSGEGQPPVYVSPRHPVPREALTGARRVPRLVVTSEGIAFLRQGKPQHPSVVRYVQRATKAKRRAMELMITSKREETPWAALEDRWDDIVGKEIRAAAAAEAKAEARGRGADENTPGQQGLGQQGLGQGKGRSKVPPPPQRPEATYARAVQETWKFASQRLDEVVKRQTARAHAFVAVREAEMEKLAEEERAALARGHRWMVDTPEKKWQRNRMAHAAKRAAKNERNAKKRERGMRDRVRGLQPEPVRV
ncbi:hypothetical protein CTA1_8973 [Colletotrichum tanaceti]|uniref:DNA repair protein n=1 Tax=Colletotrichum tanaceti TaxID=1306861 RepID=A0A4V6DGY6_9PEZI|nr:hypothetical protein CTA1_8973 [Colletotrichum tanaceti]